MRWQVRKINDSGTRSLQLVDANYVRPIGNFIVLFNTTPDEPVAVFPNSCSVERTR